MIAGFDHDDLADGSGKAGITFVTTSWFQPGRSWYSSTQDGITYDKCNYKPNVLLSDVKRYAGEDITNVAKAVTKKIDADCIQNGGISTISC